MQDRITKDFLIQLGFERDNEHYSLQEKIEIYLPSNDYCEVYVTSDDNPRNYSTHLVKCQTEHDLMDLMRLLGLN